MPKLQMAFVHSPLDRKANFRSDKAWLQRQLAAENARFVQVFGDSVRMAADKLVTAKPATDEAYIYLGEDDKARPWFAFKANTEGEMMALRPLMIAHSLPRETLSILAQARSLVHWHEKHGFCANCGHKSEMDDAGYRRHCPACRTDHFPRTDPVVIMAVIRGDKMLLGRQKAWAAGMYSAIAGFMEPGETIEQAVAREVVEETGVKVANVRYVASQPWPFPSSLMIGCIAEAQGDAITVDEKELETARWFSREEVRLMLDGKHPEGLHASHPWAIAHAVISAALQ